ncbi:MAG TPA: heme-degrading domain-containing protein [Rugosimonospora sp.]|nr:heme-degrading domain-containing protein [Rugosimonospora sp.]
MTPAPLRAALIGYGLAGSAFHAPLISTTSGLSLGAVVTADPARQEQVRRDHPDAEVVAHAEALWTRPDRFDLVVVASPNRSHHALTTAALAVGLPVVVDKPLAPTAREAQDLIDLAAGRGVPLTVFQNRRWDSDFRTARRLVGDGTLGRILRLESRYERWRPAVGTGWREREDPAEAGGLLYDLGSHLVDQALQLMGPATEVYAELHRRRPAARVDDDAFVALHHTDGGRSHLWMSSVAAEAGPRLRLLGDRAAYVTSAMDGQEEALRAGRRPGGPDWGQEPTQRWGRLTTDGQTSPVPSEPGAYPDFYAGVVAMLREGTPPPVDPADAVAALTVLEAARRSATERRVVPVETPPAPDPAPGGDDADLIARLETEQQELVLARFNDDDAWRLGLLLVDLARQRRAPVTVDIRRGQQQLFHYALPGTSADNDGWIQRKSAVVARFGQSSYLVGANGRRAGRSLPDRGLDPRRYADHGGSFPLTVAGVGVIGAVTVSGLPQADDHRLVVDALHRFLAG